MEASELKIKVRLSVEWRLSAITAVLMLTVAIRDAVQGNYVWAIIPGVLAVSNGFIGYAEWRADRKVKAAS